MREKMLQYIREKGLLRAGDRVAVAVSGGADSVALLRLLLDLRAELGIVLSVAHFNHGLRDDAAADEAFVAEIAKEHGLEFFSGHGNVRDHAFTSKLSIEAAGRELRYRWFASLAEEQKLDVVATAHTLDDQAETVLLKFLRGAGTRGLAGIYPVVELATSGTKAEDLNEDDYGAPEGVPLQNPADVRLSSAEADFILKAGGSWDAGLKASTTFDFEPATPKATSHEASSCKVIRPLLCVSRQEVEAYLASIGQPWREDESNHDRRFLRNRVRHELLPLLEEEFNPNARHALSDLAEIAREEEEYWRAEVAREIGNRLRDERLELAGFAKLPIALQRRVLMRFAAQQGARLDFGHIERLRSLARGENAGTELPGGLRAEKRGQGLALHFPAAASNTSYSYRLLVPGEARIPEAGVTLRAYVVEAEFAAELASGELLRQDLLSPELVIRNWLPGDRFCPSHSRSEEKVKRLFAEKRVPAQARSSWPVVLSGDDIIWVRGFPVANAYCWKGAGSAIRIEAIPG